MSKRVLLEETPFGWAAARCQEDRVETLLHRFKHRGFPQFGDVLEGRAGHHDKRLGAQVVTLASGTEGLLPVRDRVYPQGHALLVGVRREAMGKKRPMLTDRPVLSFPAASWLVERGEVRRGPLGELALPEALAAEIRKAPAQASRTTEAVRLLAQAVDQDTDEVVVSSGALAASLKAFLPERIVVETNSRLGAELERYEDEALSSRVPLKGGGSLVIDETEALVAIDVDLGQGSGQSGRGAAESLKDRVFDRLADAIAVRSLGGQIVLDLPRRAVRTPKVLRDQLSASLKGQGLSSIPAITKEGLVVLLFGQNRQTLLERLTTPGFSVGVRPSRVLAPDMIAWRAHRALEKRFSSSPTSRFVLTLPDRSRDIWEQVLQRKDLPPPAWNDRVQVKWRGREGVFVVEDAT